MEYLKLLEQSGIIPFNPENTANKTMYALIRENAYFGTYSYEEALNIYNKVESKYQCNMYMTSGINGLVYYDLEFTFIDFGMQYTLNIPELTPNVNKLIEEFTAKREFYSLMIMVPRMYRLTVFKILIDKCLITKKHLREYLLYVYSDSEYQFETEFYKKLFSKTMENAEDLIQLKELASIDENNLLTIYRGEATKSTHYDKALSWTINLTTAKFFQNRFNSPVALYTAKVNIDKVLAFLSDRNEHEVIIDSHDLINVELLGGD